MKWVAGLSVGCWALHAKCVVSWSAGDFIKSLQTLLLRVYIRRVVIFFRWDLWINRNHEYRNEKHISWDNLRCSISLRPNIRYWKIIKIEYLNTSTDRCSYNRGCNDPNTHVGIRHDTPISNSFSPHLSASVMCFLTIVHSTSSSSLVIYVGKEKELIVIVTQHITAHN